MNILQPVLIVDVDTFQDAVEGHFEEVGKVVGRLLLRYHGSLLRFVREGAEVVFGDFEGFVYPAHSAVGEVLLVGVVVRVIDLNELAVGDDQLFVATVFVDMKNVEGNVEVRECNYTGGPGNDTMPPPVCRNGYRSLRWFYSSQRR